MSRRRQQRKDEKARRHAPAPGPASAPCCGAVRAASSIERFAYTRSQAAEALGLSRSTFDRRVLPFVETVELPWGRRLIPIDELERLLAEGRRPARKRPRATARGRRPAVPAEVVERIRDERAAGRSFRGIASDLEADQTPTAHGGVRWWASSVRAVLQRAQ